MWETLGFVIVILGIVLVFVSNITSPRITPYTNHTTETAVGLIALGLLILLFSGITITNVSVPDAKAGVRVAKEMAYINPVSFAQAERVLPAVLTKVQIPGGWNFHYHGASSATDYWYFSIGGDVVNKVCVSYNVITTKWSAKSGTCSSSLAWLP
jgi:hypothetical protein